MSRQSRLRQALLAARPKISMAALAKVIDLNVTTTRAYFSETRDPPLNAPLDKCLLIGRILNVRGEWLFSGKGSREPDRPEENGFSDMIRVPLLDKVSAGKLAVPSSQIPVEDVPLLAFADLGPGEFFATQVDGTSMDRISPDGSIIIVNKRDRSLISGRCYLFAYQGETTYKRWQGGDPAYLEPYSTDAIHKPIFVRKKRDFEIIGRVKRSVINL